MGSPVCTYIESNAPFRSPKQKIFHFPHLQSDFGSYKGTHVCSFDPLEAYLLFSNVKSPIKSNETRYFLTKSLVKRLQLNKFAKSGSSHASKAEFPSSSLKLTQN